MTHLRLKTVKAVFVLFLAGLLSSGAGAVEATAEDLSIDSNTGVLLDNPASLAIIDKHIPGMSTSPQISLARVMPLRAVAPLSGGLITDEMLQAVEADLQQLKAKK